VGPVKAEDRVFVVLCTFPDRDQARQIGTALVERQLAACVNLVPEIESIYRWEGKVCREGEVLGIVKTTEGGFPALRKALEEMHPYEVPEIIALPVEAGSEGYLGWVRGMLNAE
jgi:periplasmic divalent cation tolerance protein